MKEKKMTDNEKWEKCLAEFKKCGYTAKGVASYLDSRKKHDPMDDDPNRDRNPK